MLENLSPDSAKVLDGAVEEACIALQKIEDKKAHIKDIAEMVKIEVDIKPAEFNALVKERFESASTKKLEKINAIIELNEKLRPPKVQQ